MSDIFRIDTSTDIKLTGGLQQEGICTHIDTRDVRTKTELQSGAQNAGGNDPIPDPTVTSVYVIGCLTGSGTEADPLNIVLNPTGGIACGDDGLYISNITVTGVIASSIVTSGCLSGSGTAGSPVYVMINPTGGIQCTATGLALQNSYTYAVTSGCVSGSGTTLSPIVVMVNPTGGLHCTAAGLALQNIGVVPTGCLSGSGTLASPLRITLNPTGLINCTPAGLALQNVYLTSALTSGCISGSGTSASPIVLSVSATGGLHCVADGLALKSLVSNVVPTGCLTGSGTVASPLALLFNPTGKIHCTSAGIALQEVYLTQAITSGCLAGIGTVGSPIILSIDPTGGLHCTPNGLAVNAMASASGLTAVSTSGCFTGDGRLSSPLALTLNPTGKIHCTPAGLALQEVYLTSAVTSGCISGSGTATSPIVLSINPTGGLHCTPGGLAINSVVSTTGCIAGSGTAASPVRLLVSATGGLQCVADGLALQSLSSFNAVVPTGCLTGSGTLASPLAILFNPTGKIHCTPAGIALQETYLTQAITSGCIAGIGTVGSPIVLSINPTGGLHCTPGGLAINATIASSVVSSGCVTGSGTAGSPITLLINPTGKIQCTAAGIALQEVYLTSAVTSGCVSGSGTSLSPISLNLNPTGGLHCTPNGLAINATIASTVVSSGCLSGSGTVSSPITITISPTGGLRCSANGLSLSDALLGSGISSVTTTGCFTGAGTPASPLGLLFNPTGKIQCTPAGIALQEVYLTQAITSGCIGGIGTAGSPIVLNINPTGGLNCTPGGLALQTLVSTVVPTGCLTGSGTVASPLSITLSPTGGLQCTSTGLALISSGVATFGCISGNGTSVSPISLLVNPTGKIQCTAAGIALQEVYLTQVITSGCITGIGTVGSPIILSINPTGGLHCTPGGLAVNMPLSNTGVVCYAYSYETGSAPGGPSAPTTPAANPSSGNIQVEVYDNVIRFWMFNGTGYTLDKEFSGGGGTPGSPSGSLQFNGGSTFSGSSNLTWDGSTLNVTGVIKTRNITSAVFAIPDGASVVLNPNSGSIQTWTLGSNRTPSGNFLEGQSITLMVDDGAGNTIDWSVINPVWLDGVTPTLPTSGYGVFELWKVGSTIYGASLTSGTLTGGSGSPGGSNTNIQFNNAGSFGGSSSFTWNGSTVGVSGSVNVSGTTLTSDVANILAQRNSTTAQGLRIYNTFTTTGNYERATIDWAGSPGVLQIGTQHAGAGTAKGLQLITSGTPRIDITAAGSVQFNSAYSFPTLDGASGQVLSTNGAGVLRFVNQSGGGATPASPSGSIQFNGGGTFAGTSNLMWDGSILGVTGTVNTKNVSNLVYTIVDGPSVDINPSNGGIQIWTLGNNRTPTASSFNQGQAVTLMIEDGSTYTVDWTTMGVSWLGGLEPLLPTSGYGVIELWKVGSTIYGASSNTASGVSAGAPVNSIQFNNSGTLGGSSKLMWTGSEINWSETNAASSNTQSGYLTSRDYGGGVASNNIVLGAKTTGAPNIRLQVDNPAAHVGVNIGGTNNSTFTVMNDGSNNGFIGIRSAIYQSSPISTPSGNLVTLKATATAHEVASVQPIVWSVNSTTAATLTSTQLQLPTQLVITVPNSPAYAAMGVLMSGDTFSRISCGLDSGTPFFGMGVGSTTRDVFLFREATGVFAQRNSTNAQALRVYNTYTNSSNYERGIFDWAGSPGVLQIGTQHAGTGTAKSVQIVTSGTPRIDIAAAGGIQFYGAYTFPTGLGSSGQALVTNGAGTLNWANVSGAGGGTPASPSTSVQFNNGGSFGGSSNFTWTGSGLNVTGTITTNNVTSAVYAIVDGPSVDINPASGSIQTWTLGATRTPTASSFSAGQAVTLMVDDGADFTINWSTINPTWIGGAPTLATSGYNVIELWKVGSTIYGASVTGSDYFTGETNNGNSSTGIIIDFSSRANQKLVLTDNCTLTFTPPADARQTLIRFIQGGSGGYSVTLPSGTLGDPLVLPTGVGSQSVVRFYYDGTVFHV